MKVSKIFIIVIGVIAVMALSFCIVGYSYSQRQASIEKMPKMYCYETYHKVVNPVLYVKSESEIDDLIKFYREVAKGNNKATFNFKPSLVPLDTCVYVIGYNKDKTAAKIASFYRYNNRHEEMEGYVDINTMHSVPSKMKYHL